MFSEEEMKKIADQNGIELLPLNLNSEPAKKSDVASYYSNGSLNSLGNNDDIEASATVGGARDKRRPPQVQLIQVCLVLINGQWDSN